ncbi:MAG TPA: TlpA disulfide reductase family protein [Candidatus Limnocylindrales bacterium]|nr:TlpA disulfide reductase family protein [Candidatus Limnocylindrales bacterium]
MSRLALALVLVLVMAGCMATGEIPVSESARTATPDPDAFFAPDFTLAALDGSPVHLADLRGQWVVLNYWATWCAPCVAEMPALQALADEYVGRASVLGVNLREDAAAVRAFAEEHSIRFPLLLNPDDTTVLAYTVVGLPQTLLIDPEGIVVNRAFGPVDVDALRATLDGAVPVN